MIRNWSIRNRVLLLALLPIISLGLVLGSYLIRIRVQDLKASQTALGQALVTHLATASEYGVFSKNQRALQALADSAIREPNVDSVSISDHDGHILAVAQRPTPLSYGFMSDLSQHIGAETGFKGTLVFSSAINWQPSITDEFGALLEKQSQAAQTSSDLSAPLGTVTVKLSEEHYAARQAEVIVNSAIIALVCVALTLLLALAISGSVTGPMERIIAAVKHFSQGQHETRVVEHSGGELGLLESGINDMAASAQRSQQELQAQVDQATAELRETLQEMEVKNVELDLARQRAVQTSRVKSDFLANMSHEIRTPMNAIIGFSDLLAKTPLNESQRGYSTTIRQAARTLLTLLDDVLHVTQLEAGSQGLQSEMLVLPELLEEVVQMVALEAYAKGLELVLHVEGEISMPLLGDRLKLMRIFTNLITNAVKFTESGSVAIKVSMVKQSRRALDLVIDVADTGIGIRKQDQTRLFEPFFQLDSSTRRQHAGAGLGLYIIKKLLEQMGGTLTLTSVPGQGSEFHVALRLRAASEGKPPAGEPPLRTDKTLLVYEAHPQAASALLARLRHIGWEVRHINAPAALERELPNGTRVSPYAAIILSLGYGELREPVKLADILRNAGSRLPVLALVNSADASLQADLAQRFNGMCLPKCTGERQLRNELMRLVTDVAAATATEPVPAPVTPPLSGLCVLVADDNRINRMLARILLEKNGATVLEAQSGNAAIETAHDNRVDLVLLDMHMPGEDGWQIARRLRARHRGGTHLPVIALSAAANEASAEVLTEYGLQGWLLKPLEEMALLQMIRLHLSAVPDGGGRHPGHQESDDTVIIGLDQAPSRLKPSILAMLAEDLPAQWRTVTDAWQSGDLVLLTENVHKLNGTAAFCHLDGLRDICNRIEHCLQIHAQAEIAGLLRQMSVEVQRTLKHLEALGVTPGRIS